MHSEKSTRCDDQTFRHAKGHWSLVAVPGGLAVILILLVLFSSVPPTTWSPLDGMKESTKNKIQQVVPQGWAFFTRSAREPLTVPYDAQGKELSKLPTARWENLYGLNREGRSQGLEIGVLANGGGLLNFNDCSASVVSKCISAAQQTDSAPIPVKNIVTNPSLCGEIYLLSLTPTPYEYRKLLEEHLVAEKWLYVDVEC